MKTFSDHLSQYTSMYCIENDVPGATYKSSEDVNLGRIRKHICVFLIHFIQIIPAYGMKETYLFLTGHRYMLHDMCRLLIIWARLETRLVILSVFFLLAQYLPFNILSQFWLSNHLYIFLMQSLTNIQFQAFFNLSAVA